MDKNLQKQIWSEIAKRSKDYVMQANDPKLWAKAFLNTDIYSNQSEIMKAVGDLSIRYMCVIGSRGSGKSFAVCAGLIKMCADNANLEVGIFGPRTDQANRLISESRHMLNGSKLHDQVDWVRTTAHQLMFKNGAYMLALSAAETSQQEGWHFDVVAIDEAHRVSNTAMTQRILPMLGSKKVYKLIKIGIPLYKNHFYQSFSDAKYKILQHNWMEAPILMKSGYKEVDGKKYPSTVLDRVPLAMKQKMFPNNPELHYDGDMTELEFQTQYNMTWVDDLNTFLSSEEQEKILGVHKISEFAQTGESYFFGLDTASGSIIPGKSDLDYTALSIWRKSGIGVKEKIACLTADTQIPLLSGKTTSIKELSDSLPLDTWVYSVDKNLSIVPGKVVRAWKTGTRKVIKITLDNGEFFKCTEDHLIMRRDGSFVEAGKLNIADSLMPLYRRVSTKGLNGYELTFNPSTQEDIFTHRQVAKSIYGDIPREFVVHHKVATIEALGYEDVYDLTIEEHHNFALDCGIFVHNCFEWQGGETLSQIKDVLEIVSPLGGLFPCAYGCVDYSNVGITAVEILRQSKINVTGIMFAQTEPSSHKNYKNAMAHHFKFELQADRVKMPSLDSIDRHRVMRKHFYEWCALERHSGVGLNDLIRAPSGSHDDGVFADMMAVWAADKAEGMSSSRPMYKIPMTGMNRGLYSSKPGASDFGKKIFGIDSI